MLRKMASVHVSRYIQTGANVLAVLFVLAWFALIGFVLLKGAFEVAGLFIVFTLLIAGLAYANERPQ